MILDSQYEDCQRAEDGRFSVLNGPLRYVKVLLLKINLKLWQSNNLHNYLVKKNQFLISGWPCLIICIVLVDLRFFLHLQVKLLGGILLSDFFKKNQKLQNIFKYSAWLFKANDLSFELTRCPSALIIQKGREAREDSLETYDFAPQIQLTSTNC